jgi:hypothetical protein
MTEEIQKLAEEIVEATKAGNVSSKDLAIWLYKAGSRLPVELTVLSEKEILDTLYKIQPEGFNWTEVTKNEMEKFRVIAQAQRDHDQQMEGKDER